MALISTFTFRGNPDTWTVARAGGVEPVKYSAYTVLILLNIPISLMYTVQLTT